MLFCCEVPDFFFVDNKTSPDFLSAWGSVDDNQPLIFKWTYPLIRTTIRLPGWRKNLSSTKRTHPYVQLKWLLRAEVMPVPTDLMEKYFREELQLIFWSCLNCVMNHTLFILKIMSSGGNTSVSDVNEHMHSLLLKSLMIFLHQLKRWRYVRITSKITFPPVWILFRTNRSTDDALSTALHLGGGVYWEGDQAHLPCIFFSPEKSRVSRWFVR